jgi:O-acetyl-ADP-ribose deacetylase (regulator of RNase III)
MLHLRPSEVVVAHVVSERLRLVAGDITKLPVDAVVTAANEALCGGGGVDGAIHRAAGPGLLEECLKIGHCPPGEARITKGYLLPAKFVIHAVGPVWEGGAYGEAEVLASCYRASLKLAAEHGAESIAFPCISTGTFGYPKLEACAVAIDTTMGWLRENEMPRQVVFCCFGEEDAAAYRARLRELNDQT